MSHLHRAHGRASHETGRDPGEERRPLRAAHPDRTGRSLVVTGLLAAAVLFGACEGDNLFENRSVVGNPIVSGLIVPASVHPGDALDVRVEARSSANIVEIRVSLRGAAIADSILEVDPPRTLVTKDVTFLLPVEVRGTELVVRATAIGEAGEVSEIATRTIEVRDGSAVVLSSPRTPASIGPRGTAWPSGFADLPARPRRPAAS